MLIVPYDTELLMWQLSPPAGTGELVGFPNPFDLEWAFRSDVHTDIDVGSMDADADNTGEEDSHVSIRK
jgi:hypothetical protein